MRGGPGLEHRLRPCSRPDCCTATSGCQRPKPPAVPCNLPTSSPPGQFSRVWNQRWGRVQKKSGADLHGLFEVTGERHLLRLLPLAALVRLPKFTSLLNVPPWINRVLPFAVALRGQKLCPAQARIGVIARSDLQDSVLLARGSPRLVPIFGPRPTIAHSSPLCDNFPCRPPVFPCAWPARAAN